MRAVIEGICGQRDASTPLPGRERVRVGALRMGSGNVLAKQFGVPRDPVAGLRGLLENLKAGRTVPCCVMRCEVWKSSGHSELHHAATLGGLGQFGRIPSDLARWHARLPGLRASTARLFGIERRISATSGRDSSTISPIAYRVCCSERLCVIAKVSMRCRLASAWASSRNGRWFADPTLISSLPCDSVQERSPALSP